MLLSYTVVPIVTYIEKRYGTYKYLRIERSTDDLLELQRLAQEELGFGTWSGKIAASEHHAEYSESGGSTHAVAEPNGEPLPPETIGENHHRSSDSRFTDAFER